MPDVLLPLDPLLKTPKQQNAQEINPHPNINFDFEENLQFQEGVMSETFQRLDKSFFQNQKDLGDLINKEDLVHRSLPKQTDIDKILKEIQRKVLKGTHLPVEVKEIQAGYLHSPISKICINTCYKIESQAQNKPLGNVRHYQRNVSY